MRGDGTSEKWANASSASSRRILPLNRAETYRNIGLLFGCEALTRTGAIIVLTTMGLAGRDMAPDPSLATLPLALVPATTMLTTIPAAHFMQRRGRKRGFALGAVLGVLAAR